MVVGGAQGRHVDVGPPRILERRPALAVLLPVAAGRCGGHRRRTRRRRAAPPPEVDRGQPLAEWSCTGDVQLRLGQAPRPEPQRARLSPGEADPARASRASGTGARMAAPGRATAASRSERRESGFRRSRTSAARGGRVHHSPREVAPRVERGGDPQAVDARDGPGLETAVRRQPARPPGSRDRSRMTSSGSSGPGQGFGVGRSRRRAAVRWLKATSSGRTEANAAHLAREVRSAGRHVGAPRGSGPRGRRREAACTGSSASSAVATLKASGTSSGERCAAGHTETMRRRCWARGRGVARPELGTTTPSASCLWTLPRGGKLPVARPGHGPAGRLCAAIRGQVRGASTLATLAAAPIRALAPRATGILGACLASSTPPRRSSTRSWRCRRCPPAAATSWRPRTSATPGER